MNFSTKSQDLCQEDDISDRPELMQSIMAFTEMFRAYLAVDDLSGEVHLYIFLNLYAKGIYRKIEHRACEGDKS